MLTGLKAWIWLTQRLECGPAWQVLRHFASPEAAYFADPAEYALVPKLSGAQQKLLADKSLVEADQILARCDAAGIGILTWQDSNYPERLRNIDLPPLVLYFRGTLPRFDEEIAIAMAGTRKATPYGRKVAAELAYQITRMGGLVLTGIVEGCDRYAADGALKAGGPLVCVLAGGVDVPYYASDDNRRLLQDVAACGALISERAPGSPHLPEYFARRNRILTGLSLGALCVEAPQRSGTLGVARLALEQGRDVYAVPANIDAEASIGTNRLLAQGEAICVCSGADVLEHYWSLYPQRREGRPPRPRQEQTQRPAVASAPQQPVSRQKHPAQGTTQPTAPVSTSAPSPFARTLRLSEHKSEFTDDELAVLQALENGALVTDAIVARSGLPARRVSATLTVLTIRSLVRQLPGGRFEALVKLT